MKHSFTAKSGLLAVSVSALILLPQAAMAAQFIPLGDLAGGAFQSRATDVSADGSTVIGYSANAAGTEAFRWTRSGGMQSIGALPGAGHAAYASAVSADGSVIAGYSTTDSSTYQAFRWTQAGGMVSIGGLGANDGFTRGDAISADGSVIVGYSSTSAYPGGNGYRWTQSTGMQDLGILPGDFTSWARGISADGSIIVGQSNTNDSGQAYRWTATDGLVSLGVAPGAATTSASDISNDGTTISGSGQVNGFSRAMVWTLAGGWENLGTLTGYQYSADAGITADGSMIFGQVFNVSPSFTSEGMIWDRAHGMRFAKDWLSADYGLDLANWTIGYVAGISDDNQIITGVGINPNGNTEAWVADLHATAPVPLPSGVWLMGSGLFAIMRLRRKHEA